ncbi:hypothetical protein Thein_1604 [Thermodesulfatator indicus DSM 15286]|uniref:DUF5132 domain-containing protein n=1 Tax=Thermodesulfatator indicus (strain DSM 15286 / JCM 11887 / CIR29812) TaxID=667014 RepID=F8AAV3_THEID|nr:DUF5132 domain-containing protein [Thermodesulfatator indicus]AEH45464.1 hypothetical protein Thein_1604 [Thermodesulfatator indicus DSM 15286]
MGIEPEDIIKKEVVTGLSVGLGLAYVLPKLLPVFGQAAKPIIKGMMKGSIIAYEKGRETLAELTETLEDLWAETKAELEEEIASQSGGKKDAE